jgi:hypothetical protein
MTLKPITIVSGQNSIRAYDDKGVAYSANPIQEYILLHSGAINANEEKFISIPESEGTHIIDSIYILSLDNSTDVNIDIVSVGMPSNQQLARFVATANTPLLMPLLILQAKYLLRIKSTVAITDVLIFTHRAECLKTIRATI